VTGVLLIAYVHVVLRLGMLWAVHPFLNTSSLCSV